MKSIITTGAPEAIGPYSQGVSHNGFVFCSGQIGINPKTKEFAGDDIVSQTTQAIENIRAILNAEGLDLKNVVKSEVFLKDMNDYALMNETYAKMFTESPLPARYTVEVSKLPKDALVEIACTAVSQ